MYCVWGGGRSGQQAGHHRPLPTQSEPQGPAEGHQERRRQQCALLAQAGGQHEEAAAHELPETLSLPETLPLPETKPGPRPFPLLFPFSLPTTSLPFAGTASLWSSIGLCPTTVRPLPFPLSLPG